MKRPKANCFDEKLLASRQKPARIGFDLLAEERTQSLSCSHIDLDAEPLFKHPVRRDEIQHIESTRGIVIDKDVNVAVDPGVVAIGRTEQIKRGHSHHL